MSIGIYGRYGGIYDSYSREDSRLEENRRIAQKNEAASATAEKKTVQEAVPQTVQEVPGISQETLQLEWGSVKEGTNRSADMEKAISDMKKDQILEEYQYFVGSVRSQASEDGTVIRKP